MKLIINYFQIIKTDYVNMKCWVGGVFLEKFKFGYFYTNKIMEIFIVIFLPKIFREKN